MAIRRESSLSLQHIQQEGMLKANIGRILIEGELNVGTLRSFCIHMTENRMMTEFIKILFGQIKNVVV